MIDSRQLSDGIRIVNVQPLSFGNRSRTIEEGAGIFGVLSDAGSVKVEIDTIVHEVCPGPSWSGTNFADVDGIVHAGAEFAIPATTCSTNGSQPVARYGRKGSTAQTL
jgi:hypothetical protein